MKKNSLMTVILAVIFTAAAIVYIITGTRAPVADNAGEFDSPLAGHVLINEAMARNSGTFPSIDGNYYDWVELFNPTDAAVDISSWGLTDSPDSAAEWAFAQGTSIPAKGFLVVFCSGFDQNNAALGELHAPFRLKAGEDAVVLLDNTGGTVDAATMVAVGDGHSIGRDAADTTKWLEYTLPTPGCANTDEGRAEYERSLKATDVGVIISEFQATNETTLMDGNGLYPDWIELRNTTNADVDLSGFGLSDDTEKPMKWVFPQGTVIEANAVLVVYCDKATEATGTTGELHASFALSSYRESVILSTAAGRCIDYVDYEGIPADSSYSRNSDGTWSVNESPTPGT